MHKGPQSQNYANQLERIKTRYQQAQIQIKQLQNRINLEKNLGASLELQVLLKGKFRELVEEKKSVEILIEQEIKRINELDDMSALAARGELAALNKLKTEAAGFQLFDPEEMVIPVLDEEWVKAEKYFDDNPTAKYMPHKEESGVVHSFVVVNGEICAKSTGQCLGQGAFGKVTLLEHRNGESEAIKREYVENDVETYKSKKQTEKEILTEVDQLTDIVVREKSGKFVKDKDKNEKRSYVAKYYTAMPLLRGASLDKLLPKETQEEKRKDALEAAKALKFVHDKGIVHADVKPANFMKGKKGEVITVTAMDFGLSRKMGPDGTVKMGRRGSPKYMAPELGKKGDKDLKTFSAKTDIWSLGKMFKEMNLGRDYDNLCKAMMEKDPRKRPTIDQVIRVMDSPNPKKETNNVLKEIEKPSDKAPPPIVSRFNHSKESSAPLNTDPIIQRNGKIIRLLEDLVNKDIQKSQKPDVEKDKQDRLGARQILLNRLNKEREKSDNPITKGMIERLAADINETFPGALTMKSSGIGSSVYAKFLKDVESIEKKHPIQSDTGAQKKGKALK